MRASPAVYIAVIAAAFGLSTLLTRAFWPNDNVVASLLDAAFVILGVAALEGRAWRQRRQAAAPVVGTLTFMFTDVENSTSLLRELGNGFSPLLADIERLVRRDVEANGGTVVDSQGDATFAAFTTAGDALHASVAVQRAVAALANTINAKVRIGIHSGRARREWRRYRGLAVHTAARICSVANGGQILMSDTTRALLVDEEGEAGDLVLRELGEHRLRGFERPFRLVEAVPTEWADRPPLPPRSPGNAEPFAGREQELTDAAARPSRKS